MPHNNHNVAASNNCFIKRKIRKRARERERDRLWRCQSEFHIVNGSAMNGMRLEGRKKAREVVAGGARGVWSAAYVVLCV